MAQMRRLNNGVAGELFPLGSQPVTLGRSQECTVVVKNLNASRQHARISKGSGGYLLEDLDSGNGTYLNGQRISGPQPLKQGDVIKISEESYLFEETTAPIRKTAPPEGLRTTPAPATRRTTTLPTATPRPVTTRRMTSVPGQSPTRTTARITTQTHRTSTGRGHPTGPLGRSSTSLIVLAQPSGIPRRTKLLVGGALAGIALVAALLFLLKGKEIDPEELTRELTKAWEKVSKIIDSKDYIKADEESEKLLDERYKVCGKPWQEIKKQHATLHELADREKKARKEVPVFIAKVDRAKEAGTALKEAQDLFGEAKSLLNSYEETSLGFDLATYRDMIKRWLESQDSWQEKYFTVQGEVEDLAKQRRYKEAFQRLKEFGSRYNDNILGSKLQSERSKHLRKAEAEIDTLFKEVDALVKQGQSGEAKKKLQGELPNFQETPLEARLRNKIDSIR